ncbi:MAG: FtsX-like permease family protein [Candidatus Acidiferrales bacterium]
MRVPEIPRLLLLHRLTIRPLFQEPLRTALTVLAVALGVSVVLAIELAGNAAAGSFRSSLETLAGDSNLEITAPGGIPEQLVGKVATLPYAIRVRPRIEGYATVVESGETLPLIGLDLVSEISESSDSARRSYAGGEDALKYFGDSRSVWTGSRLGRKAGDTLRLSINDEAHDYIVRGVFDDSQEGGSVVLLDIAAAQRAMRKLGRVDRILLKVPDELPLNEWQQRLRAIVPEGTDVRPEGSGTEESRRMLAAFRRNLRILSYIALVVGTFLIYNTISLSVVRRRAEIGIVRALGASRGAVTSAFLAEAVFFGLAGALLGLPLGRAMASGTVRLLGATVDLLYVSSRPGSIGLTFESVLLALLVGVGMAAVSAVAPAREASLVPPAEAMARGRRELTAHIHKTRDLWLAVGFGLAGAASSQAPAISGKPLLGYLSEVLLIGATVLAVPALVDAVVSISSNLLREIIGVEALLASRSLAGSLRRTSVLVGALATAIAMMVSVGIMVGSFRQTVLIWMDDQLPADLYLRPAGELSADRHPTIAVALVSKLSKLPGVAAVDQFRGYEISYQGLPTTLVSADLTLAQGLRSSDFVSGRRAEEILAKLRGADAAAVSEPFANKHHLRAGDSIRLPLGEKKPSFRIVDVYYDYGSERGYILLDRSTMLRYLPDPAPAGLAVYVVPGSSLAAVRAEIQKASAGKNILIFSNRDLRTEAIRVFDRTFAITYSLEAIAILVAVIGIAGALITLVIDRRREFGLIRFLGGATPQVRKLILVEAGLLGLFATFAGFVLGVLLSLVLIYVISKQSFGWTIRFHWPVALLVGALTVVYSATLIAGLYPARVATRLKPIEVMHEE